MSRTSKALKRLGVAGVVAATIGAGVPALVASSAQAAPGGATTSLSISPTSQEGAAGTCLVYAVTPLNATGEQPSDTQTAGVNQTFKLEATENPATDSQQIHFCAPTAPFANQGTPTRLNEVTDVGNSTTAKDTATAPADPNPSGKQTFGVRGRVPGGASLRAYIDTNGNNAFDAGEPTALATASFTAGGTDNTSDTTAGGNAAQDAVKTITEIPQSVTANPVAAGTTSGSDQFVTVQVKNAAGEPVSGVVVSAQYGASSANGAQTTPAATAQPISCRGGGTTTSSTTGVTTRTTNTAANNAAGGGSQDTGTNTVTNNAGIITCSYTAARAGTDTITLFVNQTTGGTSGPDTGEPQITVTRTTQTAPNANANEARNVDLTPEGPTNTVSGQPRTFTATVTDAAGKRVSGVTVTFTKTGGGNLTSAAGSTNAFGQATTQLTSVAGETGQAVVTADISTTPGNSAATTNQCNSAAGAPTAAATTAGNCTDSEVTNFVASSPSPSPSSSASPSNSPSAGGRGTLSTSTPDIQPNIQGILTASGLTSNAAYELRCYSRPSTTYFTARTATTSATATTLEFRILPGSNTRCYVRPAGNESLASNSVVINVHTTLSLSAVRTGVRTYIFQGRNLPRRAGQLITLYRVNAAGQEIRTSNLTTDASGIYRVTRRFTGNGTFQFKVRTSQTLNNAAGVSNTITVTVH